MSAGSGMSALALAVSLVLRVLAAALLIASWAAAAAADDDEFRVGVIIANQNYSNGVEPLENTFADADHIAAALDTVGFDEVIELRDATGAEINTALFNLKRSLRGKDNVVIFFHYSGHGVALEDGGELRNFIFPVDADATSKDAFLASIMDLDDIIEDLASIRAKAVFIVSDACRNIADLGEVFAADRSFGGGSRGFAPVRARAGTLIAYSTADGHTAPDDGIFSATLANQISQPRVYASRAFERAFQLVARQRGPDQYPWYKPQLLYDVCFVSCPDEDVYADAAPPTQDDVAKLASLIALSSKDSAVARLFLDLFPDSANRGSVETHLAALDTSNAVAQREVDLAFEEVQQTSGFSLGEGCAAMAMTSPERWRDEYLRNTRAGTFHVFVQSLPPGQNVTRAQAAANRLRTAYPTLDFAVMPTASAGGGGNRRFAIVLAEGLESRDDAEAIAAFARDCGVSSDAYVYQQSGDPT